MLDLRDAFFLPSPPDAAELRAFTHGLMPRTVPAMMAHFTDDWRRLGVDAWNAVPDHWGAGGPVGWWTLPEYLGDHFIAPLLGAAQGTCIHQPNVHWTVQCLLSDPALFAGGGEVVVTEAEFPSVLHSARRWAALQGYDLRVVPLGADGFVDRAAVLDAIGPATALVILSHVGFTTGERLGDALLRDVAAAAHRHGALFALDGYHATGSIPVAVEDYGVDVYFGGLLKEACGSSGNAFVYLREGLDVRPQTTGWFGDADPFGFAAAPEDHPDARRRFLGGTSAVASMYHAVEGVRLLLDAGLPAVRAHSLALTERCLARADAAGLTVRSPRDPDRRGAMVILEAPAADRLCSFLKQQHIYTDSRKGRYLRLAPFVWNTEDEVDRAFDAIDEALRSGTYRTLDPAPLDTAGPVT
ncbi:MAG: aminotransferase class V-fold PLP-dependent enzyme [Rhodothermales bacterium]|nr:aminotransferase class V-fold PLP-dependent enzyme [Rhodothermales bacterium]